MTAPTFSYAQAAKGRTPIQASSPSPAADHQSKDDASSVTTAPDVSAKTFSTTSDVSDSVKSSQIDADVGSKKIVENGGDDAQPISTKDDATVSQDSTKPNGQPPIDKPARQMSRSAEHTESKTGRKGKKGRSSDKDLENEQTTDEPEKEIVPVKLTEAAPPSVNFWEQRAAAAKAKQPSSASSPAAADLKSKPTMELSNKTSNSADVHAAETPRSSTKYHENRRPSADQSGRKARGHRVNEKGEQSPAPSSAVEDKLSWPTPDTVAAEDGKRKTTSEPDNKDKKDDGAKTSRTKAWQKIEINPTVVFNTPLPIRNGPKPPRAGGQAGRGPGRGHNPNISISSEKVQVPANETPAAKEGGAETQGKWRDDVRTTFASPEKSKKFSADQPTQRKHSVASGPRGSGYGSNDLAATKSDNQKPSAVHEAPKKDGFAGQREPKPRRGGGHGNNRGAHNGQQPFIPNGNGTTRGSAHGSPSFGSGFSQNQYNGPAPRGRGGRPPSLSNGYKGPLNGLGKAHLQHPHPVAPEFNQYSPFAPPSFPPHPTQTPDYLLLRHQALAKQLDYYFSDENLGTDVFLRRQMDAQGFVPFSVVANFNRIRHLSTDDENAVRMAVHDTPSIEFGIGDDKELMRRRGDWQKFITDGNSITRKPGPSKFQPRNPPGTGYYHPMAYPTYNPMSPQFAPVYPTVDMHPGYMKRHQFSSIGSHANVLGSFDQSPLNVTAPEFSPVNVMSNGLPHTFAPAELTEQAMDEILLSAQTIDDEIIACLHLVAEGQTSSLQDTKKLLNGTADGDGSGEKTQVVQGDAEPSKIPELVPKGEETKSLAYFAKNGQSSQVSDTDDKETYLELHDRAIAQRQAAAPGEVPLSMKRLYVFWAHYLTDKFNVAMYKEFRQVALEDAAAKIPSKLGYAYLVQCYKGLLSMDSKVGETWGPNHPVYLVLQAQFDNAKETVSGNDGQA